MLPRRLRLRGADLLRQAVRDADPRCFAMVMATGIVSVALRLIGHPDLSWALLWVAAVAFAVLVVASVWRVAAFGSQVRGELDGRTGCSATSPSRPGCTRRRAYGSAPWPGCR
jgi:hypothetical protein